MMFSYSGLPILTAKYSNYLVKQIETPNIKAGGHPSNLHYSNMNFFMQLVNRFIGHFVCKLRLYYSLINNLKIGFRLIL